MQFDVGDMVQIVSTEDPDFGALGTVASPSRESVSPPVTRDFHPSVLIGISNDDSVIQIRPWCIKHIVGNAFQVAEYDTASWNDPVMLDEDAAHEEALRLSLEEGAEYKKIAVWKTVNGTGYHVSSLYNDGNRYDLVRNE